MAARNDGLPWDVPIPVRKGPFECLDPKLRKYNLCVDWSNSPPFLTRARARSQEPLLFSDLQTQITTSTIYEKILGSGRSGRYEGVWLKGVGRTPLACNWKRPEEIRYASGILPASAAFRERLATIFAEKRGLGDSILGCDGVMIASLSTELSREARELPWQIPIDVRFHALAVKSADFARPANLAWLLSRPPKNRSLMDFFSLLAFFSLPPDIPRKNSICPPAETARRLSEAFERGKDFQRSSFLNGIFWGGGRNCYTLDGRTIDLETPMILGAPFLGVLENRVLGRKRTLGLESISYFFSSWEFLRYVERALELLVRSKGSLDLPSQLYAREFLASLKVLQNRGKLPGGDEKAVAREWLRWFLPFVRENIRAPRQKQRELQRWVSSVAYGFVTQGLGVPRVGIRLRDTKLPLARAEAFINPRLFSPGFLDFGFELDPMAFRFNESISKIDVSRTTHPRALLTAFRKFCDEL